MENMGSFHCLARNVYEPSTITWRATTGGEDGGVSICAPPVFQRHDQVVKLREGTHEAHELTQLGDVGHVSLRAYI